MAHLLIVDDEQSICWALGKLAEEMGLSVARAATAEQGLESARAAPRTLSSWTSACPAWTA